MAGIGGFLVDLVFAVISFGLTIHCLMSAADSLAPTPSSGFAALPLPAMAWHDGALLRGVDLRARRGVLRGGGAGAGEGEGERERGERQQLPRERVQHRNSHDISGTGIDYQM